MPIEQYEKRTDSVLAWKQRNSLGRFDPEKDAKDINDREHLWKEAKARGLEVGKRCRVGGEDGRRGIIRYVGEIPEIPNGGIWVGFEADEPTGMCCRWMPSRVLLFPGCCQTGIEFRMADGYDMQARTTARLEGRPTLPASRNMARLSGLNGLKWVTFPRWMIWRILRRCEYPACKVFDDKARVVESLWCMDGL